MVLWAADGTKDINPADGICGCESGGIDFPSCEGFANAVMRRANATGNAEAQTRG